MSRSCRSHWHHLNALFEYPAEVRRVIAIESLNSVIRKAVNKRKLFPTDDSAMKVVYLSIREASKTRTMTIRNWRAALKRLMINFEDRLINYV
ncbi:MAG: transposase [Haliea sp.]|nr:transposase [Haliea sp.]MBK6737735.1 transposase [Haliea sp.]